MASNGLSSITKTNADLLSVTFAELYCNYI